jgi:hypothetical protein
MTINVSIACVMYMKKGNDVTLDDLYAMFEKLSRDQLNELMMTYVQGLHQSVKEKDFKQMFLWSCLAYTLNELERKKDVSTTG